MKLKQLGKGILALGIFLSLSSYGFSSSPYSAQSDQLNPQEKIGHEQKDSDGDDQDDTGIDSGGMISSDENICNSGLPAGIKNVLDPSGDVEGLIALRWEKRTLSGSWTVIPGATVLSYFPDEIYETTQYRRGSREFVTEPWKYSNIVTKFVVQGIDDLSVSTESIQCKSTNTGSASATVIGGTPGYTFEWSFPGSTESDINNLPAGTYNVTATDSKGCKFTSPDFVIQEPDVSVTIHNLFSFEPICSGESSGAIITETHDGVPPYNYNWSDGNLGPINIDIPGGTYHIEVVDALGCSNTITVVINEPQPIELNELTTPTICHGEANGSADFNSVGGTAPYTYIWHDGDISPMRSDLEAGVYDVAIFDSNGCYLNESVHIEGPDPIDPAPITINNKICYASINLVPAGGNAPYTYQWEDGGTEAYKSELCPGIYVVEITDANNCLKEKTIEIKANYRDKSIEILPTINPFEGKIEIMILLPYEKPADIEVYAASGQLVETFKNRSPNQEKRVSVSLDLSKYSHGIYAITVSSAGLVATEKLIISK